MFKYLYFVLLSVLSFPSSSQSQTNPGKLVVQQMVVTADRLPAKTSVTGTDAGSPSIQYTQRQVIESELTLLENKNQLIPFQALDTLRIAALSIGSLSVTPFQKMVGNYTKVDYFNLGEQFTDVELKTIIKKLNHYNLLITAVYADQNNQISNFFSHLSFLGNQVVVFFLNKDDSGRINAYGHPDGLLLAYQNSEIAQELAAQLLFGGIGARGKLPFPVENQYHPGDGLTIGQAIRLKYTVPEEVGLNSVRLNARVDSIVNNALMQKAFPGCNVLIAKDGKVIFQKAYGFHTYEQRTPSSTDDIYDLASVTKVSGALPAIMKLCEDGKILLDGKYSTYWKDWKKRLFHPSNKSDLTVRELLAHQSGLIPFIPFYKETMNGKNLSDKWYSAVQSDRYELEVAPGLFLNTKFKNRIYKSIRKSPLKTRGKYVYSDLSVILTPDIVAKISGMKFTDYLDKNFYGPLGATTTTYLPAKKFSCEQIVPTEYDDYYRKRLIHGSVHDESAAVFGGIAGNAGLFSSANDLAKLVQMYLQYGAYGGKQYLKESTLREFNRVQFPQTNNRRGLGFDKPMIDNLKLDKAKTYPCAGATPQSFGHFGFTGTFFWADPSNGLLYIFLSNRVNPTRENSKISELNVRTDILQVMYEELSKHLKH